MLKKKKKKKNHALGTVRCTHILALIQTNSVRKVLLSHMPEEETETQKVKWLSQEHSWQEVELGFYSRHHTLFLLS